MSKQRVLILPEELEAFGLTKYESSTYITLLREGKNQVRPLAQSAKIPMGRIYDILHSLEHKGLIIGDKGRPVTYAAREPIIAISSLLENKKRDLDDLSARAKEFEEKLKELQKEDNKENVIRDVVFNEDYIEKFLLRIENTESHLRIYMKGVNGKDYSFNETKYFRGVFRSIINKGVKIQYIVGGVSREEIDKDPSKYVAAFMGIPDVEIAANPILIESFDIIDKNEVLIKISDPINPDKIFSLIYLLDKEYTSRLINKFDELWENSEITTIHHNYT